MNRFSIILLILLSGCYYGGPSVPVPPPDDPVAPVVRDDWNFINQVPTRWTRSAEDATKLAALSAEYARQLRRDGELDEPQILTSKDIGEAFKQIVEYGFRGEIAYNPEVADLLVAALNEFEPDREIVDLTDADRRKAVELFQAFAASLDKVKQ